MKTEDLFNNAMKVKTDEFLRLIEDVTQTLSSYEQGLVGSLLIKGRLVNTPQKGELIIVGDIHGDLESLMHILYDCSFVNKAYASENVFIAFLGDYGDRGLFSPEVYYVVLRLTQLFPENVILLRGNHEGPRDILAHPHDLPTHLQRKFGNAWSSIYGKLTELFEHMYVAVFVDKKYVLLHGGAPSKASKVSDVAYAHMKHPQESHLEEILWSDPKENIMGTRQSPRGAGKLFGPDITNRFLKIFNVQTLVRGHESSREGFKINHCGKILTIFSRKGPPYNNDHGAYMHINLSEKIKDVKQLTKYIKIF